MQYQYRDVKVFLPPRKILFQQPDFLHIRPTVDLAQMQNQAKLTGDGFGKRERPPGPPQPQTGQQPENGDQADDFPHNRDCHADLCRTDCLEKYRRDKGKHRREKAEPNNAGNIKDGF